MQQQANQGLARLIDEMQADSDDAMSDAWLGGATVAQPAPSDLTEQGLEDIASHFGIKWDGHQGSSSAGSSDDEAMAGVSMSARPGPQRPRALKSAAAAAAAAATRDTGLT